MSDPFGADPGTGTEAGDDWSEAFGVGASWRGEGETGDLADTTGADAGAVTSAFDFEPDSVSSDDDYDFTGDGVVDHHDVHEALSGFHDFHVDEPAPEHHDPVDHHEPLDHAEHHLHHDGHELFGFLDGA